MNERGKHHEIAVRHEWMARQHREGVRIAMRRDFGRMKGLLAKAPFYGIERRVVGRLSRLWIRNRKRGFITPTVAELARSCRCSDRAVQLVLRKMQALGWLTVDDGHRGGRGVRRMMRVELAALRDGLLRMLGAQVRGLMRWAGGVRALGRVVARYRDASSEKGEATRARLEGFSYTSSVGTSACAAGRVARGNAPPVWRLSGWASARWGRA